MSSKKIHEATLTISEGKEKISQRLHETKKIDGAFGIFQSFMN